MWRPKCAGKRWTVPYKVLRWWGTARYTLSSSSHFSFAFSIRPFPTQWFILFGGGGGVPHRITALPMRDGNPNRYLLWRNADSVGLMALPLDGNPYRYCSRRVHPLGVSWWVVFHFLLLWFPDIEFFSFSSCLVSRHWIFFSSNMMEIFCFSYVWCFPRLLAWQPVPTGDSCSRPADRKPVSICGPFIPSEYDMFT